ncbi:MAG: 50S ribosomal protein L19 [Deltaproteobacteria bacterium]|nr:50S ribosomal protein L19 [Deltaproteobacteria bacterium]
MQNKILDLVEKKHLRSDVPSFRAGDVVRVHWKIREGGKERVQAFEGVVIRKNSKSNRTTFTVRKVSYAVGVERIFPINSPRYEKIEVVTPGRVRRSRLFYLRSLQGKAARVEAEREQQVVETAAPAAAAPAK